MRLTVMGLSANREAYFLKKAPVTSMTKTIRIRKRNTVPIPATINVIPCDSIEVMIAHPFYSTQRDIQGMSLHLSKAMKSGYY